MDELAEAAQQELDKQQELEQQELQDEAEGLGAEDMQSRDEEGQPGGPGVDEQMLDSKTRHRLAQRRYRERIKSTIQDLHEEVRMATQQVDTRREKVNQLMHENQLLRLELERAKMSMGFKGGSSSQPASSTPMEEQEAVTTPSSVAAAAIHQAAGLPVTVKTETGVTSTTGMSSMLEPRAASRGPHEGTSTSLSSMARRSVGDAEGPSAAGIRLMPTQAQQRAIAPQSGPLLRPYIHIQDLQHAQLASAQQPASAPLVAVPPPSAGGLMFHTNLAPNEFIPGMNQVMFVPAEAAAQPAVAPAGAAPPPRPPPAPQVSHLASNIIGYQLAHNQLPMAMMQGQPCQLAINLQHRSSMSFPQMMQLVTTGPASHTSHVSNSTGSTPPTSGSLFHSGLLTAMPHSTSHQGVPVARGVSSSHSGALHQNLSAHFSSSSSASVVPASQVSFLSNRMPRSSMDVQASPEHQQLLQQQQQVPQQQQQVWLHSGGQGIQFVESQFTHLLASAHPSTGQDQIQFQQVQPQMQAIHLHSAPQFQVQFQQQQQQQQQQPQIVFHSTGPAGTYLVSGPATGMPHMMMGDTANKQQQ